MKRSKSYESYLSKLGQEYEYSLPKPAEQVFIPETSIPSRYPRGQRAETSLQVTPRADPEACLFVANLSIEKNHIQLKNSLTSLFQTYGKILDISIHRDWKSRPFSFVQFERSEDAAKALQGGKFIKIDLLASGEKLNGKHIRIEKAKVNRTLYISKMPWDIDEERLHSILSRYGKIQDIKPIYSDYGQLKSCYVKYEFRQDAIDASQTLTRIGWRLEWVSNLPAPDPSAILPDSVFIGRIPSTVTNEMILSAVEKYGSVTALNLVIPPGSPQVPSFCFVSFHDPQSAQICISELNGTLWHGSAIKVQYAQQRDIKL